MALVKITVKTSQDLSKHAAYEIAEVICKRLCLQEAGSLVWHQPIRSLAIYDQLQENKLIGLIECETNEP